MKARSSVQWLAFVGCALVSGCCGVIRIDQGFDAPSEPLRAGVVGRSAPCESWAQTGEKDIYLSVYRQGSEPTEYLYKSHHKIQATWPDWTIQWVNRDEVVFTFYTSASEDQRARPQAEESEKYVVAKFKVRREAGQKEFHEYTDS